LEIDNRKKKTLKVLAILPLASLSTARAEDDPFQSHPDGKARGSLL